MDLWMESEIGKAEIVGNSFALSPFLYPPLSSVPTTKSAQKAKKLSLLSRVNKAFTSRMGHIMDGDKWRFREIHI